MIQAISTSVASQPADILVVDDTPANLQVLAGMLKDRGYKGSTCSQRQAGGSLARATLGPDSAGHQRRT